MKELLKLIKSFNLNELFKKNTDNTYIQFFRYIFVGGAATVADWGVLWLLKGVMHDGLYFSTAVAFLFGLLVNYILSKLLVFKGTPSGKGYIYEFLVYILTGLIGLGFTEGIMYLLCDLAGLYYMLAKVIATAVVLIWNFGSKKIILYRKSDF
jgi:putative flippase GtrA